MRDDHGHRHPARGGRVDQCSQVPAQVRAGPVDVVDRHHHRRPGGQDQHGLAPQRHRPQGRPGGRRVEQGLQGGRRRRPAGRRQQAGQRRGEPGTHRLRRVRRACPDQGAHQVDDGGRPVWARWAADDVPPAQPTGAGQFVQQAGASAAGRSDQRHPAAGAPSDGQPELVPDGGDLPPSAEERPVVAGGAPPGGAGGVPHGDRRVLAGHGHRPDGALRDQAVDGPVRGRAERHPARWGAALQPGGQGDHRPAGHRMPAVARGGQFHHGLPGCHTHPDQQPGVAARGAAVQGALDLQPGPNGPVGVPAVGGTRAEQCHHRVADVLLDHPVPAAQHPGHGAEVSALQGPHVLRIEPVDQRGRPDDVDEQHGDRPSLLRHRPAHDPPGTGDHGGP
nr:hypothetical protein [Micromonospora nigra]